MFARSDVTAAEDFPCDCWSLDIGPLVSPPSYRRPLAARFRWLGSLTWRMGIPTGLDEPPFTFFNVDFAGRISVGWQPKARISFCPLPVVVGSASDVGGCFERGSEADCFVELNRNDRGASMVMQKPKKSSLGFSRRYRRMSGLVKLLLHRTNAEVR